MADIEPNRFRTILPQFLACMVITILHFDIGLSISYPTVIISALGGLNNKTNPDETLMMSDSDGSWFASTTYMGKIVGSLLSGFVAQRLGHRNALILISFPVIVSLCIFSFASALWQVFMANILLGFGCGYMKAPCMAYITEICEVSTRSALISLAEVGVYSTPIIVVWLGTLTPWRYIAMSWFAIQLIILVTLFFIPRSPLWLLSKQRDESALTSLKWLRGWAPQSFVQKEFEAMLHYRNISDSCNSCKEANVQCTHITNKTTTEAFKLFFHKRNMKPFLIIISLFVITIFSGTHQINPYTVKFLNAYCSEMDANDATIIACTTGSFGIFVAIVAMKMFGRRYPYLIALLGCILCSLFLSTYGFIYLPSNATASNATPKPENGSVVPLIVFCTDRFLTSVLIVVSFTMVSELYSLPSRSIATAITMVTINIIILVATKSFDNLQKWFNLQATMAIYFCFGVAGLFVMYFILPETEGRTLEDIDVHFSDDSKKLTDHHIVQLSEK